VPAAGRARLAAAAAMVCTAGMATHTAAIRWNRGAQPFTDNRYSRAHLWKFDGGTEVPASASPHVVPRPMAVDAAVDPEEAFVASLASCHMLWFLAIAAQQGYVVDDYADDAVGVMARDAAGRLAMTKVTLRPLVHFSGAQRPDHAALTALHHAAHAECFIARSVRSTVVLEPRTA
jgi:organic hydroperoxide reductase OsmC/OhrA